MDETILDNKFIYRNKEWLNYQINVLGKSKRQVARECDVEHAVISYWFNETYREKLNIKNRERSKVNYEKNKDKKHEYYEDNKIKNRERSKNNGKRYYREVKTKALTIVGKQACKCEICGDVNIAHLTIDHINEDGFLDRAKGLRGIILYHAIINDEYENLSNLRVLCWNHNCSRNRVYLDLLDENQVAWQRYATKLWKEAFNFFGPCHCGESELKFLTISHIHNDGAERRRNGEGSGRDLLKYFRKQGWPESLKEDFCLECWTCNCSHGTSNFI